MFFQVGKNPGFFARRGFLTIFTSLLKKHDFLLISGTFYANFEQLQPSFEKMSQSVFKRTKPGVIFIFHDGYNDTKAFRQETVKTVATIGPKLMNLGY